MAGMETMRLQEQGNLLISFRSLIKLLQTI